MLTRIHHYGQQIYSRPIRYRMWPTDRTEKDILLRVSREAKEKETVQRAAMKRKQGLRKLEMREVCNMDFLHLKIHNL